MKNFFNKENNIANQKNQSIKMPKIKAKDNKENI